MTFFLWLLGEESSFRDSFEYAERSTEHTVTGWGKPLGQIKTEKKTSEYVTFCY